MTKEEKSRGKAFKTVYERLVELMSPVQWITIRLLVTVSDDSLCQSMKSIKNRKVVIFSLIDRSAIDRYRLESNTIQLSVYKFVRPSKCDKNSFHTYAGLDIKHSAGDAPLAYSCHGYRYPRGIPLCNKIFSTVPRETYNLKTLHNWVGIPPYR